MAILKRMGLIILVSIVVWAGVVGIFTFNRSTNTESEVQVQTTQVVGTTSQDETTNQDTTTVAVETASQSIAVSQQYVDGTYTGQGNGRNGLITVEVTIEADVIQSIVLTEHNETDGVGDDGITLMPEAIIQANSTEVDVISGATMTSQGIIEAVNNALAQANAE